MSTKMKRELDNYFYTEVLTAAPAAKSSSLLERLKTMALALLGWLNPQLKKQNHNK